MADVTLAEAVMAEAVGAEAVVVDVTVAEAAVAEHVTAEVAVAEHVTAEAAVAEAVVAEDVTAEAFMAEAALESTLVLSSACIPCTTSALWHAASMQSSGFTALPVFVSSAHAAGAAERVACCCPVRGGLPETVPERGLSADA